MTNLVSPQVQEPACKDVSSTKKQKPQLLKGKSKVNRPEYTCVQEHLEASTSASGDTVSLSHSVLTPVTLASTATRVVSNTQRSRQNSAATLSSQSSRPDEQPTRPTAVIVDLLQQQQQISAFFKEASALMTDMLDQYQAKMHEGHWGQKSRSPKASAVCTLVDQMVDKHAKISEQVATVADECVRQLKAKQKEVDMQKAHIERLNAYIQDMKSGSQSALGACAQGQSSESNSSGMLPTLEAASLSKLGYSHDDDTEFKDDDEMDYGTEVPTEIALPQTFIDLFELLAADDDAESGSSAVGSEQDKEDKVLQKIPLNSGSVRLFL